MKYVVVAVLAAVVFVGCGDDDGADPAATAGTGRDGVETTSSDDGEQRFPDVIDAAATPSGDTWRFEATLSSPYDTPERYADAWRIITPDGTVLGVRELLHDHQNEQPFTRSLSDVAVPDGVTTVVIEGRDLEYGWGGATFELDLGR